MISPLNLGLSQAPKKVGNLEIQANCSDRHLKACFRCDFGIATTHIKPQLISGDNSYQFEKATTHIKR